MARVTMANSTRNWLKPADVERLAQDPSRCMQVRDLPPIDMRKPFLPEEHTQLYYTPVYASMHYEHRLRYNQLFGARTNEYIMMLESDLIDRLLVPLRRHPKVASDLALVRCIDTMITEERRHYQCFAALNRACFPTLYQNRDRLFAAVPWSARVMFGAMGLFAGRLPFALWYMMAMEESSAAIARDMMRRPASALGELEPTFMSVHREHMKDELRHVQIDGLLVDLCLGHLGRTRRALNVALFKRMLGPITRPKRSGSGVRVVRELVRQMPELSNREDEMIRAVLALKHDKAFQTSLFNRSIMPLTFGVYDAVPEFDDLDRSLVGYDRR